jgi:hypothetical protein
MFNLHKDLNTFFQDHVRLGKTRWDELARFRDASLTRLNTGLDKLGEKRNTTYAYPNEIRNQGGYAMRTLNQATGNEYDIDVALIFKKDDLPSSPKSARERIRDAFLETAGGFKEPPTARKNAVTVWYATGQHLDFAVYRRFTNEYGQEVIEHAGGDEWTARDPDKVTKWFDNKVKDSSPRQEWGATVEDGQLRKIVRFVKFFTKCRSNWKMPGGMMTTALVVECYCRDSNRDDIALLQTLEILRNRLLADTRVWSPVDGSNLAAADERRKEVENLRDRLGELLPKLRILNNPSCTREQARNAWRQFFNHSFWNAENDKSTASLLRTATVAPVAAIAPVGAAHSFPNVRREPSKPQGFA